MYTDSNIWKNSLENKGDGYDSHREKLRSSFSSFRERIGQLVQSISQDSIGLTVHDLTHMDALWQMADILTGGDYQLNPAEAYVLGGAILLHDSALTIAAYTGGIDELKETLEYKDAYASIIKTLPKEVSNEPSTLLKAEKMAISESLRVKHAAKAEELASQKWRLSIGDESIYLIDDKDLRDHYSIVIGRIAHSHHWDISKLSEELNFSLGALSSFPNSWVVDQVKVALLLRCIDAMHIDDRRAPSFLASIREIGTTSMEHWRFQNKLALPHIQDERIIYTSKQPFVIDEADAWNLCFDTIQMIDRELENAHELHLLRNLPVFKAHGVAGAGSAESLAKYIGVKGWKPIPLSVKASDVPKLALTLGGNDLYNYPLAPLRELIQNAADAIEARCLIDKSFNIETGLITIRLTKTPNETVLEVEDNGVGMSEKVITKALLDFGFSFWKSSEARNEYPGLQSSADNFRGKYGIGFFSVFMWAKSVKVFSHRFIDGPISTKVLEFRDGLESRPILRDADISETSSKWSSKIQITIKSKILTEFEESSIRITRESRMRHYGNEFLLSQRGDGQFLGINQLKLLSGTLPMKVMFEKDNINHQVSLPNWRSCEVNEFVDFFGNIAFPLNEFSTRFIKTLSLLTEPEPLGGRCFISPQSNYSSSVAVYDKGIFVSFERVIGISGVAQSSIRNAARDRFNNINLYMDKTWVDAVSDKAFSLCENLGEKLSIQELLTKLSRPNTENPLVIKDRNVISISELKEKILKDGIFHIRLFGNSRDEFKWKKAEKLELITGLTVDKNRVHPLIEFDGTVDNIENNEAIENLIATRTEPLFVFIRDIRDCLPNFKLEIQVVEVGGYNDDYIDIKYINQITSD